MLKVLSLVFIPVNFLLAFVLIRILRLHKLGLHYADIAFPLFFVEFYYLSDQAFYHSLLPQLVFALSLLALGLSFYFLRKKRTFYYPKFFKYFWRAGFLLTFFLYLAMTVSLFLIKN